MHRTHCSFVFFFNCPYASRHTRSRPQADCRVSSPRASLPLPSGPTRRQFLLFQVQKRKKERNNLFISHFIYFGDISLIACEVFEQFYDVVGGIKAVISVARPPLWSGMSSLFQGRYGVARANGGSTVSSFNAPFIINFFFFVIEQQ